MQSLSSISINITSILPLLQWSHQQRSQQLSWHCAPAWQNTGTHSHCENLEWSSGALPHATFTTQNPMKSNIYSLLLWCHNSLYLSLPPYFFLPVFPPLICTLLLSLWWADEVTCLPELLCNIAGLKLLPITRMATMMSVGLKNGWKAWVLDFQRCQKKII